jgi:hypothetical protein
LPSGTLKIIDRKKPIFKARRIYIYRNQQTISGFTSEDPSPRLQYFLPSRGVSTYKYIYSHFNIFMANLGNAEARRSVGTVVSYSRDLQYNTVQQVQHSAVKYSKVQRGPVKNKKVQ